jgi:hypothetical protein
MPDLRTFPGYGSLSIPQIPCGLEPYPPLETESDTLQEAAKQMMIFS